MKAKPLTRLIPGACVGGFLLNLLVILQRFTRGVDLFEIRGLLVALVFGCIAGAMIVRLLHKRRETQEALRQASLYSRILIETSPDPLVTISADGKITDVNTATERVTGHSRDRLIGTDFSDYFTDPERARAGYQQVFREGSVKDYELDLQHRNGQVTSVLYNASVYRDESGEVVGVFAAARDITYRKKAAEILRQASLYNRTLIETSPDPLVTISNDGKITDVNLATEELTGCSRDELIGTDFSDYFSDPEKARAGYQQVFRDGCVTDYELDLRHENGQARSVLYNASVYRDESGEVVGVFAAARDITYRKKAEEILRQASLYNRTLIETSVDPLVTISPDGKITDVNLATEELTGCSRDELIGTDFSDYFTEPERARAGYRQAFEDGFVKDYELDLRHENGQATSVLYNASVYRDKSGEVVGVFAAARDISKRKQAEELLKRAHDQLEQRVRDRTAELQSANEELLIEIEDRKKAQRALASEKQRFQTLVEDAPFGMVMVGEDGSFQYVNPKFRELFGYDLNEIPNGKEWFRKAFPDPDYRHEAISTWVGDHKTPGSRERRDRTYTVRAKDGTDKIIHFGRVELETGQQLVTCQDVTDRTRAAETIRGNLEFLTAVMESLTHPFYVVDANDYTVLMANSAANLDLSSGEATCYRLTHHRNEPCNGSEHLCPVEEVKKTRRTAIAEHVHYDKDGRARYVQLHAYPVLDAQGNVAKVIEYSHDITERKRAEESLRQARERLELVLQGADLGFWDLDVQSGRGVVNQRAADMLGYSLGEIEPTVDFWASLIHPDDRLRAMETLNSHLAGRVISAEAEYRMLHKSGEWKWILSSGKIVESDKDGRPVRMTGTFMDITDRKIWEHKLSESEERYRVLFESAGDAIYVLEAGGDRPGQIVSANPAAAAMHGYTTEEMLSLNIADLETPESATRVRERMDKLFKEGILGEETTHRRKDGTVFPIEINARLLEVGNRKYSFAIDRDISERKRTEEALKSSEERYRSIVENSFDGIFIQRGTKIVFANSPLCEMLGYTESELEGLEHWLVYHPDDQALTRQRAQARMRGEEVTSRYEVRLQRKDGTSFDGEISARAVEVSGQAGIQVWVRDITERKRSGEALQQSETRYRTLFNESMDGIYVTSRDGELLDANQAFFDILGYKRDDIVGRNIHFTYVNPSDRDRFVQAIEERGFLKDYRLAIMRKDGKERDCLLTSSQRRAGDRTVIGYHGIIRDVTEQKNLQRQLLQAQKMEAIGTLAGGVAHDFNNILQVALGYSELILGDEGLPQGYRADLQKINESSKRGAELVKRLLIFSRKADTKPQPLNLNRRITEMREMLERTIPKMIDIQLFPAEDLAAIHADPTEVDQVLMNLAVNARDAMPDGGKLIVETANITLDEEYAKTHLDAKPGQYVLLMVTDTGAGMDNETLDHIFEPFFTTKAVGEGTGLGLATVYGIVQQHEGHIRCYSEPGAGTTFKIHFPALVSDEEPEEKVAGAMPRGGSENILLVDDEEIIRDLCSRILTKAGYRVITASNGKDALQVYQARSDEIALVILDLIMPEMGGKQCLEGLLNLNPSVKVVIASGYSANGPTKDALAAGAKGFVNKPYDIRQVLEVIRSVLDEEQRGIDVSD